MEETEREKGLNDQDIKLVTPETWRKERARFRRQDTDRQDRRSRRQRRHQPEDNLPSLAGVVDFAKALGGLNGGEEEVGTSGIIQIEHSCRGSNSYQGPLFGLEARPGFVHAPCALNEKLQLQLAHWARTRYCKPPHTTNVDAHLHRPSKKQPELSWASVGFHFDWTHRRYNDEDKSQFPTELSRLTSLFSCSIGKPEFEAQAGIINFYKPHGNMGCHVDDSEDDTEHPVVSVTLGLPALFLVGTKDREEAPIPVLLRPGDVMMLDGESRLCYHGVAGVFPKPIPLPPGIEPPVNLQLKPSDIFVPEEVRAFDQEIEDCPELVGELEAFLAAKRVNMNMRQVLLNGRTTLLPPK